MKNKRHLFYGVKRQLFIFSTAIIVALLFIIGIVFIRTTNKTLYNLAISNHTQITRQMLTDFQKGVTSLTNVTQNYLNSPYIQEALSSSRLTYQSRKYLISSLYYPNNNYLDYSFYINNDNTVYTSSGQTENTLEKNPLFEYFLQLAEPTYSRPLLVSDKNLTSGTGSLYMIRKIRHLSINCDPGLLILHLGPDFYSNLFTNIDIQNECSYYLLDSDFTVAYSRNKDSLSKNSIDSLKDNLNHGGENPYFYENNLYFTAIDESTGFILLSVVPYKVIMSSSYTFFRTILLVLLSAIGLSIPLILLMSTHFTRPIRYIANNMKSFSTDSLRQPLSINTNTELDSISSGCNQMLENILELLQTMENNQSRLHANEYNLLLHQINPHFLYNTLDNIHMLARLSGDNRIVTLICELSSYLRISLSKGHETITVLQELSHIQSYMTIEQIRTDNFFTYSIEAEESTHTYLIPKLIIQPIVENSIKYGFASLESEVMNILNKMPYLPLEEVTDTFAAMPGGYGIANVICRLKLRYGTNFSMYYEFEEGTRCTIELPLAGLLKISD